MKFAKLAAAAALATAALPIAANATDIAVGATVFGPQGGEVGTVEKVENGVVLVNTGKHRAPLPADAFGVGETGPTITVTQAQLNAMLDEQLAAAHAKRDAALVAGTSVMTADHQPLGTIKEVTGDQVIVERETGPITLMREHFAAGDHGLMALFTLAQLEQAMAAQAGGQ